MTRFALFLCFFGVLGIGALPDLPARADERPSLRLPLDCALGEDCWVARYPDRGDGESRSDYTCGTRTQEGHRGTDITLASLAAMAEGVDVVAVAPGEVIRLRDGEPEGGVGTQRRVPASGRECGNGLLIDHGGGWQSQYCHLRKGTLMVAVGDQVQAGDPLGQVGLSGETQFPHVHLNLFRDGAAIDPFDGQPVTQVCGEGGASLWEDASVGYEPLALLSAELGGSVPDQDQVWLGGADQGLSVNAQAMVLTGKALGARAGDRWRFQIWAPDGAVFYDGTSEIDKDQQFVFRYGGRKAPDGGLVPGQWRGTITVTRNGAEDPPREWRQDTEMTVVDER